MKHPLLSLTAAKYGRCSRELEILERKDWAIYPLGLYRRKAASCPVVLPGTLSQKSQLSTPELISSCGARSASQRQNTTLSSHWIQLLKPCCGAGDQTTSTVSWRYSQTSFQPQLTPWHQCLHSVDAPFHPRLPQKFFSQLCLEDVISSGSLRGSSQTLWSGFTEVTRWH